MVAKSLSFFRDRYITIVGIIGFTAALTAAAQVAIPIPGTAVPVTLQALAVVLAGMWLGPVAGGTSMLLYLALGAAGVPVFAPIGAPGMLRLLGPTGGYLLAYPIAAFVAGAVARKGEGYGWRFFAALAGMAVIHIGGLIQLTILTGSPSNAASIGTLPFVGIDTLKAVFAGVLAPGRPTPASA